MQKGILQITTIFQIILFDGENTSVIDEKIIILVFKIGI